MSTSISCCDSETWREGGMHFGGMQNFCCRVCISSRHEKVAGTHLHTQKSTQNRVGYSKFSASRDTLTRNYIHLHPTSSTTRALSPPPLETLALGSIGLDGWIGRSWSKGRAGRSRRNECNEKTSTNELFYHIIRIEENLGGCSIDVISI
jgi:hypothetical protein